MRKGTILRTAALATFLGLSCSCENKTSNTSVPAPPKSELVSDETPPVSKEDLAKKARSEKIERIVSECFDEPMKARFTALYDRAIAENPDKRYVSINPGVYKTCDYPYSEADIGSYQKMNSYNSSILFINSKGETTFTIVYPKGDEKSFIMLRVQKSENDWKILGSATSN